MRYMVTKMLNLIFEKYIDQEIENANNLLTENGGEGLTQRDIQMIRCGAEIGIITLCKAILKSYEEDM